MTCDLMNYRTNYIICDSYQFYTYQSYVSSRDSFIFVRTVPCDCTGHTGVQASPLDLWKTGDTKRSLVDPCRYDPQRIGNDQWQNILQKLVRPRSGTKFFRIEITRLNRDLLRVRAPRAHTALRHACRAGWERRWWGMLSCAQQLEFSRAVICPTAVALSPEDIRHACDFEKHVVLQTG